MTRVERGEESEERQKAGEAGGKENTQSGQGKGRGRSGLPKDSYEFCTGQRPRQLGKSARAWACTGATMHSVPDLVVTQRSVCSEPKLGTKRRAEGGA